MGFMDKMKDLVGITDEYDDDYDSDDEWLFAGVLRRAYGEG